MSTGGGIGGEESFTTNLAESLHQRGWDVRVAAVGAPHLEELRRRGLRVEHLPIDGRKLGGLYRGARALAWYAACEGIHVLHAQSAGPAVMSILARELRLFRRPRPAILWHDHGIVRYGVLSKLFNCLDISIANSDFEKRKLIAHGLRPHKVVRIHNGIDTSRLSLTAEDRAQRRARIRQELGFDDGTPVVGFVGRLSPEKAPDDFVSSFRYARKLLPEVRYLVIGDGVMRPQLEQMIRDLDAGDRVLMTGFRRDIPDLLCAVDVLALVSHMETFSLTTLEAMAMHLPCVVTAVGGNPEQVTDGENGRLVPDRNPQSLAEALVEILLQPGKQQRFGEAGFDRVHTYLNRDRMVAEIESVYDDFCLCHGRR
jgi:glycosyltransferase involved in cell wall biosynthesis